ncbi:MAG: OsmC family protein [Steroidobacteraceae bacterium]|jgi:putative redox protein|nr:OsmC family protein [Steroidobacteraceae bacterium]
MITTESTSRPFVTIASNGNVALQLDAPIAKGGGGDGFGAHELLEASVAVCINMAVRMYAVANGILLKGVRTQVELSRPDEATTRFNYSVQLEGELTPGQRAALYEAARSCPVRQTLSRRIEFKSTDEAPSQEI